jgi:KilA-N domain
MPAGQALLPRPEFLNPSKSMDLKFETGLGRRCPHFLEHFASIHLHFVNFLPNFAIKRSIMAKLSKIEVKGVEVSISSIDQEEYVSLTDIARFRDADRSDYILQNWLRNRSTIEFIGLWELFRNQQFDTVEFERLKNEAGSNSFSLTPMRWIQATNAVGIFTKKGRYGGGTYAHKDIAFEFASWISAEFKFYLIMEFQRLGKKDAARLKKEWNVGRMLAKVNYRIHTDSIQENLIPKELTSEQTKVIYASEADLLNIALFGITATQWRKANPELSGNMRDNATIEQLVVLANLESMNALLINQGLSAHERLKTLNAQAVLQIRSLLKNNQVKLLASI